MLLKNAISLLLLFFIVKASAFELSYQYGLNKGSLAYKKGEELVYQVGDKVERIQESDCTRKLIRKFIKRFRKLMTKQPLVKFHNQTKDQDKVYITYKNINYVIDKDAPLATELFVLKKSMTQIHLLKNDCLAGSKKPTP